MTREQALACYAAVRMWYKGEAQHYGVPTLLRGRLTCYSCVLWAENAGRMARWSARATTGG